MLFWETILILLRKHRGPSCSQMPSELVLMDSKPKKWTDDKQWVNTKNSKTNAESHEDPIRRCRNGNGWANDLPFDAAEGKTSLAGDGGLFQTSPGWMGRYHKNDRSTRFCKGSSWTTMDPAMGSDRLMQEIYDDLEKVNARSCSKQKRIPLGKADIVTDEVMLRRGKEEKREDSLTAAEDVGRRMKTPDMDHVGALASGLYVRVKYADMLPSMQLHAFSCARAALEPRERLSNKDVALTLKKEFDKSYGLVWHCIVGSSFGSFVTYSAGGFIYFCVNKRVAILLFKTSVEPLSPSLAGNRHLVE